MSTNETDMEVVMSVSGATRTLVFFCKDIGVKPSSFLTEGFVGKASVAIAMTSVPNPLL